MRLLVVSSWFPVPPDNGAKLRALHLVRHLARHHRLTLLTFAEAGQASPESLAPLDAICDSVAVVPGHPSRHGRLGLRGLLSPVPRSYVQTFDPVMARHIESRLAVHDLAIGFGIGSAVHLRGATGRPRVFEEAEVAWLQSRRDHAATLVARSRLALTSWKLGRFMRDMVGRFDRTTVVSGVERQALARMGADPSKIAVVPNGVEPPGDAIAPWPRSPQVIYPGAMTYAANLDAVRSFLRDAWPLVRQGRPDASFLVTGSTDGVDLASLPSREAVTLTGRVPDVRPLVAESAACLVPLRLGGGTRLKILEAMALGTPVVSTSKGAEGLEVTPDHDILIADDPRDFARQTLRVLNDAGLSERLAGHARALVTRLYTWETIGAQLDHVLHEAVEAFGPGARP